MTAYVKFYGFETVKMGEKDVVEVLKDLTCEIVLMFVKADSFCVKNPHKYLCAIEISAPSHIHLSIKISLANLFKETENVIFI